MAQVGGQGRGFIRPTPCVIRESQSVTETDHDSISKVVEQAPLALFLQSLLSMSVAVSSFLTWRGGSGRQAFSHHRAKRCYPRRGGSV
jgi:hypothetical protein